VSALPAVCAVPWPSAAVCAVSAPMVNGGGGGAGPAMRFHAALCAGLGANG
jgi:hypothetical protein